MYHGWVSCRAGIGHFAAGQVPHQAVQVIFAELVFDPDGMATGDLRQMHGILAVSRDYYCADHR